MNDDSRLTKTKEQWAKARRGGDEREVFYEGDNRLPPGQHLVETFPVLDLGFKPDIPLADWTLTIGGSGLLTSMTGGDARVSGLANVGTFSGGTLRLGGVGANTITSQVA